MGAATGACFNPRGGMAWAGTTLAGTADSDTGAGTALTGAASGSNLLGWSGFWDRQNSRALK